VIRSDFPVGQELIRIEYELFDWGERPSPEASVDDVAMAVRLEWGDSSEVRVTWRNPAYWEDEGLLFGDARRGVADSVDVSDRWSSFIGEHLEAVSFSYSMASTRRAWAMNLRFSGNKHLVIALGELISVVPSYLPDNLVVTASEEIAKAYWPSNADGHWTESSAWGQPMSMSDS